jgi:hypothetical protein
MRREDEARRIPLLSIAGRLGSVTRESAQKRLAANLLAWLSGPKESGEIASRSNATTLFRQTHLSAPRLWADRQVDAETAAQYASLVAQTQSRAASLSNLRISGQSEYMAALDAAVRSAIAQRQSPREALRHAAVRWQEITKQLGTDRQRQAYQLSLGLDPASR